MPRRTASHPFAAKVGARVRELRLERNMSLADLADASGISKGHISSVEHGLLAITLETLGRLAKGLGLPPFAVFAFAEDDEIAQIADLVRRLPATHLKRLQQVMTRMLQSVARTRSGLTPP